ncbi:MULTISPECIES: GTPase Era [unclassified Desulfovibrio]|uniref:GTPase Era n=1 Tax=unclassified Desulfovibrio TaxID=2593640 RepID=UPI0013EC8B9E|nr:MULTISPECIES: GTPase Era [unclassified Desulfovibrio]
MSEAENTPGFRCGWVAIAGPPNAGKSTLLNALLGQKVTIVTPKPQTTRNQIVGIFTDSRAQIIFMDTPGVAQLRGHLSKSMIQAVWQSLNQANVILLVLDAHLYIRHPEYLDRDLGALGQAIAEEERPTIVVPNKVDVFGDKSRMLPLLTRAHELWPRAEIFPVSAQNGDGLVELRELIESKLPVGPAQFPEDQVSTAPLRFMAAEIIREKLFLYLHQEVPYGVAVEVESWQEDPERGLTVIHAVIYVARPTYKSMVIGKGGAGIKKIGSEARKEIAELIDGKVHLELWVKVRENWTEDAAFLRELEQSSGGSGE